MSLEKKLSIQGSWRRWTCEAFSLVEVTIAIGIASFCLLSVLGLLMTGLTSGKSTVGQTVASGLLSTVFSDIVATDATTAQTKIFGISLTSTDDSVPQTLYFSESGKPTGTIGSKSTTDSRYRISIGVRAPASTSPYAPTVVRIVVTWPAMADSDLSKWPSKSAGMVEVVTALSRY